MKFITLILFALISFSGKTTELKMVTLNLHGHHPMDEERRILSHNDGREEIGWAHLHYFKKEELRRGLGKRQKILAQDVNVIAPDIIFLQEVGGGFGEMSQDCRSFYADNDAKDLAKRLSGYQLFAGCRGNVGWWTDSNSFNSFQVRTEGPGQTVFERGDNPYPHGLMVEGTAILTSPSIIVHHHQAQFVVVPSGKESFFIQYIKFSIRGQNKWWIAVNIHGGHKVQHFEQAVATRKAISDVINKDKSRENFGGIIVAGDFNAYISTKEVSTIPWSFYHRWQNREQLTYELTQLNHSQNFKPFANFPEGEATYRIKKSIDSLFDWFELPRHAFDGSLDEVFSKSMCRFHWSKLNPMCYWEDKIDHVFISENIKVLEASGFYSQNNWTDLAGTLSDHPAVWAKLDL